VRCAELPAGQETVHRTTIHIGAKGTCGYVLASLVKFMFRCADIQVALHVIV